MDLSKRILIKCLFISKYIKVDGKNPCLYDIAIITDDERYIEYELVLRQKNLTEFVVNRIKSLFGLYRFVQNTSVCLLDSISESDPIFLYLSCIGQQVGFDVRTASLTKILNRIFTFKPSLFKQKSESNLKCTRYDLQKIWRRLAEIDICPWITQKYNERLYEKTIVKRYKKQIVRLGSYYMLIKRYKYEKDRNSNEKRVKRECLNSENGKYLNEKD